MTRSMKDREFLTSLRVTGSDETGSALIAVLVVTMILSVLISSILMGFLIQSKLIDRDQDRIQAMYSAEAGIYQFLADSVGAAIPPRPDSLGITLDDSSQVDLRLEPFGGYLLVSSTARIHKQKSTILGLVGEDTLPVFNKAVVLGDLQSALTVAGSTAIHSDILMGPRGMKQSDFKGEPFKGQFNGVVKNDSVSPLPEYRNHFYKYEIAEDDSLLSQAPDTVHIFDSDEPDFSGGFPFKSHQIWYRSGDLRLSSQKKSQLPEFVTIVATGNLDISGALHLGRFDRCIAGKSMTLTDSVGGDQALLYAKDSLRLRDRVKISGQFIAQKEITVENRTYLQYPSVVYLAGYIGQNTRKGTIDLRDNSRVNGTVILPKVSRLVTGDSTKVTIDKGSVVRGALYNSGKTEMNGTVLGTVMTFQFYLYRSPTVYINWLLNARIDQKKRPNPYIVPMGFSQKKRYKLLTWQEEAP